MGFLGDEIRQRVAAFPADRTGGGEGPWREPVTGFADASDPLFAELKRAVGPDHLLPSDLLEGARTVVAYFLPFARSIPVSNVGTPHPSVDWADAYLRTNALIEELNGEISGFLEERGFRAACRPPMPMWRSISGGRPPPNGPKTASGFPECLTASS